MLKLTDFFASQAKTNRVFIIPTFLGLKLLCVNIILLSMGLIYANNYLLLFNFIFFCLFIISMFYTHFNLYGTEINIFESSDGFANDRIGLSFKFNTPNKQFYPAIFAKIKIRDQFYRLGPFDIDENGNTKPLEIRISKRGIYHIKRVELQTTFPLNLFKAFSFFKCDTDIVVYPELTINNKAGNRFFSNQVNDNSHFNIRDYVKGDRLNRISWKKSREDSLKTKVEINDNGNSMVFNIDNTSGQQLENELSLIAGAVKKCNDDKISFGITSPNGIIPPAQPSARHFKNTLRFLANYEP